MSFCIEMTLLWFKYPGLKEPLNLRNGWLLWAGIGFFGALVAIALLGSALTFVNGENPQRDEVNTCDFVSSLI